MSTSFNTARNARRTKATPAPDAPPKDTIVPEVTDTAATVAKRRRAKPATEPAAPAPVLPLAAGKAPGGNLGVLAALMRRLEGATIAAMVAATGWQAHSVRGAMAGALKKKFGLVITSNQSDGGRVYRIAAEASAS